MKQRSGETLKRFGIIGNPLGHSYSEAYFTDKFAREAIAAVYEPHAIKDIDQVREFIDVLEGFNVTYPYKESIMSYLSELDDTARSIGAVNVVKQGKGYNTDWLGFSDSLRPLLTEHDQRALLLGTGGVSKAIQYALKQIGIAYTLVSRSAKADAITYAEINEQVLEQHRIIVNCTPLGMAPYTGQKPDLPYHLLSSQHLLYDCIYNPAKTAFLLAGEEQGCRIQNGLQMLHLQADYAWQIWNS